MIDAIAQSFIPVAVNLYTVRDAQGEEGEFFRSIFAQRPQYQGIWTVSPTGEVLGAHHDALEASKWTEDILRLIDNTKAKMGLFDARAVVRIKPYAVYGSEVSSLGEIALKAYTRYLVQGRPDGPVVLDSVVLTRDDLKRLAPVDKQRSFPVPPALLKKFAALLSPQSDRSTVPLANEITEANLEGTVTTRGGQGICVHYRGKLTAEHTSNGQKSFASAAVEGAAAFAPNGEIQSLIMALWGEYRHFSPGDEKRKTGAVAIWRKEGKS